MKLELKDILQKEIPTNRWLVKDTIKKIIRAQSQFVEEPESLNNEDILCMHKLIDFVRYSQCEVLNPKEKNDDYLRPAVGLAAPQIGINKNIFYIRIEYGEDDIKEIAAINAKIISNSVQKIALKKGEGCLSVDGDKPGIVRRHFKIEVTYFDFLLKKQVIETLKSYEAIVFQHELDHINGKLYYDHIDKKDPLRIEEDLLTL